MVMSIEEAINKRLELEANVTQMLRDFEKQTGLRVDAATFQRTVSGDAYLSINVSV
jgi:hypothetical protein